MALDYRNEYVLIRVDKCMNVLRLMKKSKHDLEVIYYT